MQLISKWNNRCWLQLNKQNKNVKRYLSGIVPFYGITLHILLSLSGTRVIATDGYAPRSFNVTQLHATSFVSSQFVSDLYVGRMPINKEQGPFCQHLCFRCWT